ncbi:hypothetical protein BOX15_Mlig012523g1 [Macrostomum lignano]|uniref:RBR-type E3 ubiquitin transferase n=1 Tax=Macrostomum lignano TaxID=282301 RepID=A0A267FVN8_9PLAT|nr:hypothetical protein BOX15_Mlig012523g1 [Macrostomum lignano]
MATVDCSFCGDYPAEVQCETAGCSRNLLCKSCDQIWHNHPNRKNHQVRPYQPGPAAGASAAPVAAPRSPQSGRPPPKRPPPPQPTFPPPASSSSGGWQCQFCTFINEDSTRRICSICGKSDGTPPIELKEASPPAGSNNNRSNSGTGVAKPTVAGGSSQSASYSSAVLPSESDRGSSGTFDSRAPAHQKPDNAAHSVGRTDTNDSDLAFGSNKNAHQNSFLDVKNQQGQFQGQDKANDLFEQQRQYLNNVQQQRRNPQQVERQKELSQREQHQREQQQRELREKEQQEREQQQREQQQREQQQREQQQREQQQREQQKREQQQREQQQREQQQREQQKREQQQREQQQREQQQREQQQREQQQRERQLREQQQREQQQREQQQREQQQREQQQREQQQREQQQREQQQREQQQREQQQEQNRQLHEHHATNIPSKVASQNFQENNSQSDGNWVCKHCTLVNPAPSQPENSLAICSACSQTTELSGGATKGGAVARSEAVAAASMLTSAAAAAASDAVGAAGSDSSTGFTEWSDRAQNLASQLRVEDWVAERILVVKSMPKFKEFSESDLAIAIESCGGLAFEDDALMSQLRRKCSRCSNELPRHKLVAMAACECQMCPECFRKFLLDLKSSRIQCPVCHCVCDDEDSRDFMMLQLVEMADVLGSDTVEYAVAHLEASGRGGNSNKNGDESWVVVEAPGKKGKNSKSSKDAPAVPVVTSNGYCPHGNSGLPKKGTQQFQSYCKHCNQDVCKKCSGFWTDHQQMDCNSYRVHAAGIHQKDYNKMHIAAQNQSLWPTDAKLYDQMMELLTSELVCPDKDCSLCYQRVSKSGVPVFHCRCGHSFCPFCRSPQKRAHGGCSIKGLHVHHHRQCFFNLKQAKQTTLLDFLRRNKVKLNETCSKVGKACELPDLKMERNLIGVYPCTEKVTHKKPGICDRHYREYIIQLINAHKLDLVDVANENELLEMFKRFGLALPKVKASNPASAAKEKVVRVYRDRLKEMVPPLRVSKEKETLV